MSVVMEEEIKRWTVRRKSALVLEIIRGLLTAGLPEDLHLSMDGIQGDLTSGLS